MQVNELMVIRPRERTLSGEVVGEQVSGFPLVLFPDRDMHAQVAMLAYIKSLARIDPAQANEYVKLMKALGIEILDLRQQLYEIEKANSRLEDPNV